MSIEAASRHLYRHPLFYAATLMVALLLLLNIDFSSGVERDKRGRTPLYLAAESGDLEKVKILLRTVRTPDQCDDCKWTPLMRAAQNGHVEVVRVLIDAGADVGPRDKGGYTPLLAAAAYDNVPVLELLLGNGADIDAVDAGLGWTALMWSAREGRVDNVAVLLAAGADARMEDFDGKTAYQHAVETGHAEIASLIESAENP